MSNPYVSPADVEASERDALWVLRSAVAMVAIAAWLFVMFHIAMIARAEWRLHAILQEANAFATLPQISNRDVTDFIHRHAAAAGVPTPQAQLIPHPKHPGKVCVEQLSVPKGMTTPKWIQKLSPLEEREMVAKQRPSR